MTETAEAQVNIKQFLSETVMRLLTRSADQIEMLIKIQDKALSIGALPESIQLSEMINTSLMSTLRFIESVSNQEALK